MISRAVDSSARARARARRPGRAGGPRRAAGRPTRAARTPARAAAAARCEALRLAECDQLAGEDELDVVEQPRSSSAARNANAWKSSWPADVSAALTEAGAASSRFSKESATTALSTTDAPVCLPGSRADARALRRARRRASRARAASARARLRPERRQRNDTSRLRGGAARYGLVPMTSLERIEPGAVICTSSSPSGSTSVADWLQSLLVPAAQTLPSNAEYLAPRRRRRRPDADTARVEREHRATVAARARGARPRVPRRKPIAANGPAAPPCARGALRRRRRSCSGRRRLDGADRRDTAYVRARRRRGRAAAAVVAGLPATSRGARGADRRGAARGRRADVRLRRRRAPRCDHEADEAAGRLRAEQPDQELADARRRSPVRGRRCSCSTPRTPISRTSTSRPSSTSRTASSSPARSRRPTVSPGSVSATPSATRPSSTTSIGSSCREARSAPPPCTRASQRSRTRITTGARSSGFARSARGSSPSCAPAASAPTTRKRTSSRWRLRGARALAAAILEHGVVVRVMDERLLRITVGHREENDALLAALGP